MRTVIGGALLGLLAVAALLCYEGWIVVCLWEWFVMPFGLPAITLAHAVGLALFHALFVSHHSRYHGISKEEKGWRYLKDSGTSLYVNTTAWGIGFVIHRVWMGNAP